jgi:hypothetical protein
MARTAAAGLLAADDRVSVLSGDPRLCLAEVALPDLENSLLVGTRLR